MLIFYVNGFVKTYIFNKHDLANGVDWLEAFVFYGACPENPRVNMLEQKIQGLTTNV